MAKRFRTLDYTEKMFNMYLPTYTYIPIHAFYTYTYIPIHALYTYTYIPIHALYICLPIHTVHVPTYIFCTCILNVGTCLVSFFRWWSANVFPSAHVFNKRINFCHRFIRNCGELFVQKFCLFFHILLCTIAYFTIKYR